MGPRYGKLFPAAVGSSWGFEYRVTCKGVQSPSDCLGDRPGNRSCGGRVLTLAGYRLFSPLPLRAMPALWSVPVFVAWLVPCIWPESCHCNLKDPVKGSESLLGSLLLFLAGHGGGGRWSWIARASMSREPGASGGDH